MTSRTLRRVPAVMIQPTIAQTPRPDSGQSSLIAEIPASGAPVCWLHPGSWLCQAQLVLRTSQIACCPSTQAPKITFQDHSTRASDSDTHLPPLWAVDTWHGRPSRPALFSHHPQTAMLGRLSLMRRPLRRAPTPLARPRGPLPPPLPPPLPSRPQPQPQPHPQLSSLLINVGIARASPLRSALSRT